MKFSLSANIHGVSPAEVYSVFTNELLSKLSPPFAKPETKHYGGNRPGDRLHFVLKTPIGAKTWIGKVTEEQIQENEIYFIDEGEQMPFGIRVWKHKHRIIKTSFGTQICDEVQFEAKNSFLTFFLLPAIWLQFLYRKPLYEKIIKEMLARNSKSKR